MYAPSGTETLNLQPSGFRVSGLVRPLRVWFIGFRVYGATARPPMRRTLVLYQAKCILQGYLAHMKTLTPQGSP
jgi:hypothetical protein